MKLHDFHEKYLHELMSWFNSEIQLKQWSGPQFEYPYTEQSFIRDLNRQALPSFVLLSDTNEFIAFGQFYLRLNRCHLGRLVVKPSWRGKGVINQLIVALISTGQCSLGVNTCSLFVLAQNKAAISAYQKAGFVRANYPEKLSLKNCLYMIKDSEQS